MSTAATAAPTPSEAAKAVESAQSVLTLSKSTVWIIGFLVSLSLGLSQYVANMAALPPGSEIQKQLTGLSEQIERLEDKQREDKRAHDVMMRAILTYQIEQDRYLRNLQGPQRPVELDEAARRIRELLRQ